MTEAFRFPTDQYLLLGRVAKAHGLRGEMKLFLHSGQPENIEQYRELHLVDHRGTITGPLNVLRHRLQGKSAIVLLATINDRNGSEKFEGCGVLLAKSSLPTLGDDEYYWHRLLGKAVVDASGKAVGTIRQLFHNGAQDVLVVESQGREILIPMTKTIVIGETETSLIVDPPPGLLEIGEEG